MLLRRGIARAGFPTAPMRACPTERRARNLFSHRLGYLNSRYHPFSRRDRRERVSHCDGARRERGARGRRGGSGRLALNVAIGWRRTRRAGGTPASWQHSTLLPRGVAGGRALGRAERHKGPWTPGAPPQPPPAPARGFSRVHEHCPRIIAQVSCVVSGRTDNTDCRQPQPCVATTGLRSDLRNTLPTFIQKYPQTTFRAGITDICASPGPAGSLNIVQRNTIAEFVNIGYVIECVGVILICCQSE